MRPALRCSSCDAVLPAENPGPVCATCGKLGGSSAGRLAGFHTPGPPADSTDRGAGAATAVASTLDPADGAGDSTGTYGPAGPSAGGLPPGYEFRRELGVGGMGRVVLAYETAGDRLVALKFLKAAGDRRAVERFAIEFRAAARLDHPNVVRVHHADPTGPAPYIAMEYVEGATLAHRLAFDKVVPPGEAAGLIRTAARAVGAAHAAGVVHRDLKPHNLMMSVDGVLKVGDFGLAKRTDRDDGMTLPSGLLGTPEYMAPEQCGGRNEEIGPATDVYGLGATLYHLMTGEVPHRGKDQLHTLELVKTVPVVPPRGRQPRVPADLEAVCLRAMAKEPAARYESAEALAADLDRFLTGETPQAAVPPPAITRVARVAKRAAWRGRWVVVGLALVALGGFAAAVIPRRDPPPSAGPPARRPADDFAAAPPAPEVGAVHEALRRGEPVTLVGPTGRPKWHAWRMTPSELGRSPLNDDVCTFQSADDSLLELLPDPGVDGYRVSAEVRQVVGRDRPGAAAPVPTGAAGFYLGAAAGPLAAGRRATTMVLVSFRDHPPAGSGPARARLEHGFYLERPDVLPAFHESAASAVPFAPVGVWPGLWRRVVAEVRSDGVRVFWHETPDRPPVPLIDWPIDKIESRLADHKRRVGTVVTTLPPVPGWHPRGGLGVWCHQSTVAVRNVVVEPLP